MPRRKDRDKHSRSPQALRTACRCTEKCDLEAVPDYRRTNIYIIYVYMYIYIYICTYILYISSHHTTSCCVSAHYVNVVCAIHVYNVTHTHTHTCIYIYIHILFIHNLKLRIRIRKEPLLKVAPSCADLEPQLEDLSRSAGFDLSPFPCRLSVGAPSMG